MHTHSTVSDGTEAPAELVAAVARAGLDVFALTDHDSTAGWGEAAATAGKLGLTFVPGMEISCRTLAGVSVHVLSYLHDPADAALLAEVQKARDARLSRAERMVERLSEDFPVTWTSVSEHVAPGATVGRPHIADALVAAGVVADRSEAFASILTSRSRYWISHYAPHPVHAVELVRGAGGVPVFAHPAASGRGRLVDDAVMAQMIDAGLAGLEIDHRDNSAQGRERLRALAAEHGLIRTGSSDYHGAGKVNRLGENLTSKSALASIEEQGTGSAVVRP